MIYEGIDRWNCTYDSLSHYKYVKKVKIGPFTRYFYSMKDYQNYYNESRKNYNKKDEGRFGVSKSDDAEHDKYFNKLSTKAKYIMFPRQQYERTDHYETNSYKNGKKVNNRKLDVKQFSTHTYEEDKYEHKVNKSNNKFVRKDIDKANRRSARINTAKFFLSNLFGSKSKLTLKKKYKKGIRTDTKKHRGKRPDQLQFTDNRIYKK